MKGKVNARNEALIQIVVCGRMGKRRKVTAIVDTGYNGWLTLPAAIIQKLRLQRFGQTEVELGDGRIVTFGTYAGSIMWGGRQMQVEIYEAQTNPLIGMELLTHHVLTVHVKRGGTVTIRKMR